MFENLKSKNCHIEIQNNLGIFESEIRHRIELYGDVILPLFLVFP